MIPLVTANAKVSMTAFRRAGSSRSVRKTEAKSWNRTGSATLNTGSAACLAAPASQIAWSELGAVTGITMTLAWAARELTVTQKGSQPRRVPKQSFIGARRGGRDQDGPGAKRLT